MPPGNPASTSRYAKQMRFLSRRIFGQYRRNLTAVEEKDNAEVVKMFAARPVDQTEHYTNYYPLHPMYFHLVTLLRHHGLYRDEHLDFKDYIKADAERKGKVFTLPGQGKRAKLKGK